MASLFIVCEGDSLTAQDTAGQATQNKYWPNQMAALYSDNRMVSVVNAAVSGEQLQNMIAQAAAQVDAAFDARKGVQVCTIWAGTNDIRVGARTGAQVYADLLTYCAARRSAGFKVIVITMLPRGNFVGGEAAERLAFNASVKANWATFCDALVDTTADSRLQSSADTTYFNADTIHLNNTGYALIAAAVKVQLDSLL